LTSSNDPLNVISSNACPGVTVCFSAVMIGYSERGSQELSYDKKLASLLKNYFIPCTGCTSIVYGNTRVPRDEKKKERCDKIKRDQKNAIEPVNASSDISG
jgi:hypothetical protein